MAEVAGYRFFGFVRIWTKNERFCGPKAKWNTWNTRNTWNTWNTFCGCSDCFFVNISKNLVAKLMMVSTEGNTNRECSLFWGARITWRRHGHRLRLRLRHASLTMLYCLRQAQFFSAKPTFCSLPSIQSHHPRIAFKIFSSEYLGDRWENSYLCTTFALVAKLVDAPDLGSGAARREGSSPFRRTPLMNAKYRFIPAI